MRRATSVVTRRPVLAGMIAEVLLPILVSALRERWRRACLPALLS